jgi:hypothetical protein
MAELPPDNGRGWAPVDWLPKREPHLRRVLRATRAGLAAWALGAPDPEVDVARAEAALRDVARS